MLSENEYLKGLDKGGNMEKIFTYVVAFFLVLGLSLLLTWPLMLVINLVFSPAALYAVFGATQIGFWKTFGLTVVSTALFKGTSR